MLFDIVRKEDPESVEVMEGIARVFLAGFVANGLLQNNGMLTSYQEQGITFGQLVISTVDSIMFELNKEKEGEGDKG